MHRVYCTFKKRTCPMPRAHPENHSCGLMRLPLQRWRTCAWTAVSMIPARLQRRAKYGTSRDGGSDRQVKHCAEDGQGHFCKLDESIRVDHVQSVIKDSETAKIIIFSQYRAMIDLVSCSRFASSCTTFCLNSFDCVTPPLPPLHHRCRTLRACHESIVSCRALLDSTTGRWSGGCGRRIQL